MPERGVLKMKFLQKNNNEENDYLTTSFRVSKFGPSAILMIYTPEVNFDTSKVLPKTDDENTFLPKTSKISISFDRFLAVEI